MSYERFFVSYKPGLHGTTPKGPWDNLEIAEVKTEDHRNAPMGYWIHAHGNTPDDALAAVRVYLERHELKGIFEIGTDSVLSTDRTDKDSLGCFFQLQVVDPARAHKLCSEPPAYQGWYVGDAPIDVSNPYDPEADRAFLEYLDSHPLRGPQPY